MKNLPVKPENYGLEKTKATELIGNLPQIIEERSVMESQYSEVVKMDVESPEAWNKARELRLLIQKNRTKGINVWHKNAKDYFLKGGQFVDAIKRKEIAINERMESQLMEIERYEEIQRQKKIEALQVERMDKIRPYIEDERGDLGEMDEDVFEAFYKSKKQAYEEEQERLKKEEEARIERERKEAEERERIRKENERLKKEREELEAKAEAERKAREEEERKEREAHEAALRKEREERERVQKELEAKAEAERKAREEEEARVQRELNKGDKDKVNDLIKDLNEIKSKYSFKSEKNKKMFNEVSNLIDKVILFIQK